MTQKESLGIKKLDALHYFVRDVERSRRFYVDRLDFAEIGTSGQKLEGDARQRSLIFRAEECTVVVSQPTGPGGRAHSYLRKHPDGVGALVFEVEDIQRTFRVLEAREATPISDVETFEEGGGKLHTFAITTPFGDTHFRFIQRDGFAGTFPGASMHAEPKGGKNVFGFHHFDHVTSNFQTMKPALLWMEHVLGFERFWDVEFHTTDVAQSTHEGSGLRSVVMWDPHSGVKFANNEPYRPFFKHSQIHLFHEDNRGDGVQHAAITVRDIVGAVRALRTRGVEFMPTPGAYYDALPQRLEQTGIGAIEEDIAVLRDLQILVDGDRDRSYLLQIFLKESAGLYGEAEAGPFFYEIIQRKGDQGFGAGNFRALFESIEREQRAEGRI